MKWSVHLFPALAGRANFLFQELFGGTDRLQLLETPLEQHCAEVGQRSFLTGCIFLKFGPHFLADPNADLNSPFSHFLSL